MRSATPYTYRVVDADTNVSATDRADLNFDITIEPDTEPGFGSAIISDRFYAPNVAITPLTLPAATGGNAPLSHTLARTTGSPALPPGLSFDADNRVLSGIPTTTQGAVTYAYRVRDTDADVAELSFTITITDDPVATDLTVDLYRNPDAPATPTVIIDFNDLIADSVTADSELVVALLFFDDPGVELVDGGTVIPRMQSLPGGGGTVINNVLTLSSPRYWKSPASPAPIPPPIVSCIW